MKEVKKNSRITLKKIFIFKSWELLRLMMTINELKVLITTKTPIFRHLNTAHVSQITPNEFCIEPEWIAGQNLGNKKKTSCSNNMNALANIITNATTCLKIVLLSMAKIWENPPFSRLDTQADFVMWIMAKVTRVTLLLCCVLFLFYFKQESC